MQGWRVEEGMTVYGSDGQEIGKVGKVWPESSTGEVVLGTGDEPGTVVGATMGIPGALAPGGSPGHPGVIADASPDTPSMGGMTTDVPADTPQRTAGGGYFKVERGGLPIIGGKDLYVPFQAIQGIDDRGVRLNVTSDGAGDQGWQTKPDWLD